jgi:hypothetical protein
MNLSVICPHCEKKILVVGLEDGKDFQALKLRTVSSLSRKDGLRTVTDSDRKVILTQHLTGWGKVSKRDLGKQLGLSVGQISAVCAWVKPTLGGEEYVKKYMGDRGAEYIKKYMDRSLKE